jgi:DNA-binding MarR family transcriptional regulator
MADEADDADDAVELVRSVKRARDALIDRVRRATDINERSGLRAVHTQVFESLDPQGSRLTVMAERARISHQAMGEMVEELIRYDYLERVPDPDDGRARLIRTTARGRAELTRATGELHRLREQWEAELDGITVDQVVGALQTLIRICYE